MTPELIIGVAVLVVVLLLVAKAFFPGRRPKESRFKCAGCSAISQHTARTIEAWRNNKTKFFCQSCHAKWLQNQPASVRASFSAGRSGCFSGIVLFAVIPLGLLLMWAYA